jgi:hypothetical protein
MEIDAFLERYVDGYLLSDLAAMAPLQVPAGQPGSLGYPMVMTTLSGIELLGVLTSAARFSRSSGEARFCEFWGSYLYPGSDRRLAEAVYGLVRHGLAHSFMTKPLILVTKCWHGGHLTKPDAPYELLIDALWFADHFKVAYTRVRAAMDTAMEERMQARLSEIRKDYQQHPAYLLLREMAPLQPLALTPPSTSVTHLSSLGIGSVYSSGAYRIVQRADDK